ncbi:hypothetical protein AB0A63_31665 [Lentzea sp. NPDC042327]|uniref:hypothetical protein n=1 Tax=Lentzea sp. NPDC042327 TaxID=3154801 RepID=UPI0033C07B6E
MSVPDHREDLALRLRAALTSSDEPARVVRPARFGAAVGQRGAAGGPAAAGTGLDDQGRGGPLTYAGTGSSDRVRPPVSRMRVMTTQTEAGGRADWLTIAGACVVELGSAVVSVYVIGALDERIGLHPLVSWVPYGIALSLHLAAVLDTRFGARASDVRALMMARHRLKVVTAALMLLGGLAALDRAGADLTAVFYVGAVCGLGPLLMLLVFLGRRQAVTTSSAGSAGTSSTRTS